MSQEPFSDFPPVTSKEEDSPEITLDVPSLEPELEPEFKTARYPISHRDATVHGVFFDAENQTLFLKERHHDLFLMDFLRGRPEPSRVQTLHIEAFETLVEARYAQAGRTSSALESSLLGIEEGNLAASFLATAEDLLGSEDDAPVIRLLNAVFFDAIQASASDIHIEPYEHFVSVRFRVDGVLVEHLRTKAALSSLLITRVKVISRLDIAEKRVPQDGRVSLRLGRRTVDLRVSTMPTSYGERVVMRLLDKQKQQMTFESLGMPEKMLERFESAIRQPNGIVLVTGPTGSGKTTTLYAALARLDRKQLNIMTVEDPLEYYMEGVSQTQINVRAGLTFAKGLRAILRQDPDVIMIGEIRDAETAQIAVQASLTGHLVFSTVHTNSALGAVTRLLDMNIEPFLLSSTLQALLAQRLVRRLCVCRVAREVLPSELFLIERYLHLAKEEIRLFEAKGCPQCGNTGYQGRMGIFEFVLIDDKLRTLIAEGASEQALQQYAFSEGGSGVSDLRAAAFRAAIGGLTTFEEAARITSVL